MATTYFVIHPQGRTAVEFADETDALEWAQDTYDWNSLDDVIIERVDGETYLDALNKLTEEGKRIFNYGAICINPNYPKFVLPHSKRER